MSDLIQTLKIRTDDQWNYRIIKAYRKKLKRYPYDKRALSGLQKKIFKTA